MLLWCVSGVQRAQVDCSCARHTAPTTSPGYLVGDISDNIGKFLHDKVDTLEAGLFQPGNLFLYNGLEGHVGGKKANSDAWREGEKYLIISKKFPDFLWYFLKKYKFNKLEVIPFWKNLVLITAFTFFYRQFRLIWASVDVIIFGIFFMQDTKQYESRGLYFLH